MLKKFADLFYDLTIGLVQQYQSAAIDLAKIEAASMYIKTVKKIREHLVAIFFLTLFFVIVGVGIVMIPIAFVVCAPLAFKVKAILIAILGVVDICIPLAIANRYLSEETWMKLSKSDEILEKVIGR